MTNTARQRDHDHAILTASGHTGWWDESGHPAPWPHDFFDPDSDWRPSSNDIPTVLADVEHPF